MHNYSQKDYKFNTGKLGVIFCKNILFRAWFAHFVLNLLLSDPCTQMHDFSLGQGSLMLCLASNLVPRRLRGAYFMKRPVEHTLNFFSVLLSSS
jgi:hypothetical protein